MRGATAEDNVGQDHHQLEYVQLYDPLPPAPRIQSLHRQFHESSVMRQPPNVSRRAIIQLSYAAKPYSLRDNKEGCITALSVSCNIASQPTSTRSSALPRSLISPRSARRPRASLEALPTTQYYPTILGTSTNPTTARTTTPWIESNLTTCKTNHDERSHPPQPTAQGVAASG